MSDTPVVFKRSKAKAAQRARQLETDTPETTSTEGDDGTESPSTLASKLKKKARVKPKSRLSFGADDEEVEGETFQIKKSNLSRKLKLPNAPPSSLDQATITPRNGGPVYDAAYLSELKASTPGTLSRPQPTQYDDTDRLLEDQDLPVADGQLLTTAGEAGTIIPSASSITAAKQKRGRLRTTPGTTDDYISLSLTKREDMPQGPHPESRLMREDDELGEGDDEYAEFTSAQERIALGKKSRKAEANKRREEMMELIADADEQDEETAEWENEQLRRGGHVNEAVSGSNAKLTYKPNPIPPVTPIPTLSGAQARLATSLTVLTSSHAQNSTALASLAEERILLDAREREMREAVISAEEKRSWFASFKEWIESVATFLDEKFPQLEKLEDDHLWLLKERRDKIAERRRRDDEDDLAAFLGSPPLAPGSEEFDDMGRVIPQANREVMRRERRSVRATRRAQRRQVASTKVPLDEGFSTDSDLSPSDAADYAAALQDLSARAADVLADVRAPEFREPQRGLGKWFGEWRTRYTDIYTGAWGGLGMVGAWEFWARLEIVGWNPLESNAQTMDAFGWYVALYEYSRPSPGGGQGDEEEPTLGPEGDLSSAMVSTAVVPRVCKIIEGGALDPYSSKDIRRLVDLAEQTEVSLERTNPKFQLFMKAALTPFQNAIAEIETIAAPYLTLNQPRFDPEAIPARRRLLTRYSKLLVNLLRWRRYTGDLFGIDQLAARLITHGMLPIAESGWDVGGEERMRNIMAQLPHELVPDELRRRLS